MKHLTQSILSVAWIVMMSAGCVGKQARVNDPTGLQEYVESARKSGAESESKTSSLWTSNGYRSNLFRDMKARFVNDVLTVRVSETTQAVASADNIHSKTASTTAGIDGFIGLEKKIKELPNMVSGKNTSSFAGKGATSRATTLETALTARVTEVLPNGYLVVEGKREVRVNNENQIVCFSGVVRPEDISTNNVVLSSAVGQMSVRVQGKGAVSQPIKPGWLYKILMGVLPF
jgi:flagellar L-ring protein FlgH